MKKLLIIALTTYCVAFAALVYFQATLIYPFNPTQVKPESRLTAFNLITPDDANLILWAAKPKGKQPTILYFHGNAGNLANRAERFDRLLDRGYGLVALAYRGSSGSTGEPSQTTLQADSILTYLQMNAFIGTPNKVVFYGESLGTAVALHLAAKRKPDAIILEAPFTSLKTLARESMPYFPTSIGLRDTWDSLAQMPQIDMPLLVMHGTADAIMPFEHGTAIFAAAPSPQKTFRKVEGLGHSGHWSVAGQKAIYRFIDGL
jgi:pimeloyl-ACP methyl ester carboxylesterase